MSYTSQIKHTLNAYFQGQKARHEQNVKILMEGPVGVAEHPDVMQTIEDELGRMAHFDDVLKMLNEVTSNGVSDQLK
mgnify:CR=1 FL=1